MRGGEGEREGERVNLEFKYREKQVSEIGLITMERVTDVMDCLDCGRANCDTWTCSCHSVTVINFMGCMMESRSKQVQLLFLYYVKHKNIYLLYLFVIFYITKDWHLNRGV